MSRFLGFPIPCPSSTPESLSLPWVSPIEHHSLRILLLLAMNKANDSSGVGECTSFNCFRWSGNLIYLNSNYWVLKWHWVMEWNWYWGFIWLELGNNYIFFNSLQHFLDDNTRKIMLRMARRQSMYVLCHCALQSKRITLVGMYS